MRREQIEDEQEETCWEMKTEGVHIKEILYLITKIPTVWFHLCDIPQWTK